jgi:TatD DNase family protein
VSDPEYPPLPEALVVPVYDNHTHLEMGAGGEGLDYLDALGRASSVGVRGVVQVGTDLESSRWGADVAAREPRVLAAVALHPNDAPELERQGLLDEHIAGIAELAGRPRVRAVGETGLDFFRTEGDDGIRAQIRSFEAHIAIAKEHDLALQIHDRDAHEEVVRTLDRVGAPERTVFHCFSGDADFARLVAERGWYLSFSGTVTFKNAQPLRDALEAIPRNRILVETDAPYLTPTPYRGRPNSAYLIPWTVRSMAETLGTDASMLAAQISSTTELVYGRWDDEPVDSPPGPFDAHPEGSPGPR